MEQTFKIKTPDGKFIEGMLNGNVKKPLILLVHGLSGYAHEALHQNAVSHFTKQGFSVFRINLYSWKKNHRKLHECTLQTHGEDIDTVLKFLKKKGVKKIMAAGHSYGFPSILHTKTGLIDALVSWDGSNLPYKDAFLKFPVIESPVKGRIIDSGYFIIMGEEMAQESTRVQGIPLAQTFNRPIKMIGAEKGNGKAAGKVFKALTGQKALAIIKGASHNFTEVGAQEKLYKETVSWFKKFI